MNSRLWKFIVLPSYIYIYIIIIIIIIMNCLLPQSSRRTLVQACERSTWYSYQVVGISDKQRFTLHLTFWPDESMTSKDPVGTDPSYLVKNWLWGPVP